MTRCRLASRPIRLPRRVLFWLSLVLILAPRLSGIAAEPGSALRLTLPPAIYAVVGAEMNLYFDNVVLTETPDRYHFEVECDLGKQEQRRWTVTPGTGHEGPHVLRLTVLDAERRPLAAAETVLHVSPSDAGQGRMIRLLLVGDSLTHATVYPNELARLLATDGNPSCKMLGTHKPTQAAEGVAHEGYGGWTWQRFATHHEPNPDGTYRKRSSPFVFADEGAPPRLDVQRYLAENGNGQPPDFVLFLLGINDCFSVAPDDGQAVDERIDAVFQHADLLLAAFRRAAPQVRIGVCLVTPPNAREAAFQANYQDRYHRWGWKRIQHRLVERQIARYGKRQAERTELVPTELNLDPLDGYPENNAVHPNAVGYAQIAGSMYGWLKHHLATDRP